MAGIVHADAPSLVHAPSVRSPAARRHVAHLPTVRDPSHRVAPHDGELWAAWTDNMPLHELIAERAYFLWLAEGRPEGRALAHWLTAEHQLRREMATVEFSG